MIPSPFLTGFALGFSLILAIGAQNAFVLRQGLLKQHVLPVVLFCAVSLLIADFAARHAPTMFGLAAVWLAIYGAMRLRSAANPGQTINPGEGRQANLAAALITAAVLTFGNPHVYLDTVVLIGTVSLQFDGMEKIAYGAGAGAASLVFFFSLGFGATLLAPQMQRKNTWRILDTLIALVMFALAFGMARVGG